MASDQPASAADRAHEAIREAIMRGEHPPGAMLSENELASALGVSRTPVRAALSRLRDEGWVTIYPKRGALVRELPEHEVREAADVRNALETCGVRRGEERVRLELAEGLADNLAQQEQALSVGDFSGFVPLAMKFHRTFVEMARNSVLLEVYDRLQDRQSLSIVRSANRISGEPDSVMSEHRTLLAAAAAGDWTNFALHLDAHQTRNHGLES